MSALASLNDGLLPERNFRFQLDNFLLEGQFGPHVLLHKSGTRLDHHPQCFCPDELCHTHPNCLESNTRGHKLQGHRLCLHYLVGEMIK